MNIRPVEISDAAQIKEIYNHYIKTSPATFETEPIGTAEMEKRIREKLEGNYPFLVAAEVTAENEEITGYAYAAQFKPRAAYRHTVEISVYIKDGFNSKGIATLLYERLFHEISRLGFHAVIAGISLPNEPSVKLHEKFGMKQVAQFKEVGFKFGKWVDTGYWEIVIND
jgi:L-amino acid N-acyltransferase YncA